MKELRIAAAVLHLIVSFAATMTRRQSFDLSQVFVIIVDHRGA